ncbi:hypothetical protein B0A52_09003 [Exophiala mesophila]|uniref:Uncharacterized protein n=1 Tax=Exophiala mesophila TaxID=212818 RepID=A0A438MT58_EXOME|nr:hypothetical protein B0A52_09003 [Exophiala mesophila]
MSGRYAVEDLLNLRASPLVRRPSRLPPNEEWMGPQDATAKRPTTRGKADESSNTTEAFQKRPLIDSQRRTTTDPERLVLGPPRRSFASSNTRPTAKTLEGSDDTKDRSSFPEKTKISDSSDSRRQGRRDTQTNGRHGNRNESEEPEVESRREYDRRPKWGARERADHQDLEDDQDDSRPLYKRDSHSRAKLSQSWFRKDNGEALEDTRRDNDRPGDWRRDRTRDRDWDRSNKPEADPEWMDAAEPEEPFQAHTQEDFQRWKERMKAGGASADKPENTSLETSKVDLPEKQPQKIVVPEPDDSMDKFFARFEQKSTEKQPTTTKSAGKTRFASLFSPPVEQNKQVEAAPSPPVVDRPSSAHRTQVSPKDADQAGFARILEMLQTRSSNPTPQNQDQQKPKTPLYARDTQARPEGEPQAPSSDLLSLLGGRPPSQHPDPSSGQPAPSDDRYNDSRSPSEQPTHTRQQSSIHKDEMLLNLLRQASLAHKPHPQSPHQQSDYRPAGGMYPMPPPPPPPNTREDSSRPRGAPAPGQDPIMAQRRETGRSMFDESPMSMYPIEPGPREQLQRRPTNGTPRGYDDDPLIALLRGQSNDSPIPPPPQQGAQRPPPPPGFQRPPGLEQMPRSNPSWPPQQPQPQQQPPPLRHPSMPPGLPNVPRGMSGPPYGQPQQIPQQPNMVQQPQRPPPQRKYTNESPSSAGLPNFPPGMGPPPGFMNAGGPPPGFPNLGPGNFPGRFPPELPSAGGGRPYMENMYGDGAGRGIPNFRAGGGPGAGNGGGAMPGYR